MAEAWRGRRGPASSIRIPSSTRIRGPSLRKGLNTCPLQAEGSQTWQEFLQDADRSDVDRRG